jgi:hypothetical protein
MDARLEASSCMKLFQQLGNQPADNHSLSIRRIRPGRHQSGRSHTAEAAHGLHQQHLGPKSRGTDGRAASPRAAAGDHEIIITFHGDGASIGNGGVAWFHGLMLFGRSIFLITEARKKGGHGFVFFSDSVLP